MKSHKTKVVTFKRKREGKTDYNKRLKLLASNKPRLVIRKSLKNITAQIVEYGTNGDKVTASAHSRELIKMGWKGYRRNLPAAYLVGLLCGVRAKQKNATEAVLDLGLYKSVKGSIFYATLKGVLDAGVHVPHDDSVIPPESRLVGAHTKSPDEAKKNYEKVKHSILKG